MMRILLLCICLVGQSIIGKSQSSSNAKPAFLNLLKEYPNVRDFSNSEDTKEAYFSAQSPLGEVSAIMMIKKIDERWNSPEIASFSGKFQDLEPFLSLDGLSLYFASNRPLSDTSDKTKDYDIWRVERKNKNSPWSNPINLGSPVNTEHNEFYPSLSANKNLYFTSDLPDSKGKDDIFFSSWNNDSYSKPVSLSDSINSDGYEFNAYIAPDESFLIFSGYNREDGLGSGDLYISYKKKDQSWSKAKNLGSDINSQYMDYCPYVNTKTNILYFTSKRSNLEIPNEGFNSANDFLKIVTSYENGLSRIYLASFENFLFLKK